MSGDSPEPPFQQVFIHIAKGCNLHIGEPGKTSQVVFASSVKAADSHPDTIVGTKDFLRTGEEGHTPQHGQAHRELTTLFEKVPTPNL